MRFCRRIQMIWRTRWKPVTIGAWILVLGLILIVFNLWSVHVAVKSSGDNSNHLLRQCRGNFSPPLVYAVFGRKLENGYLNHVFETLEKAGYVRGNLNDDWYLLWSHEYPFRVLKDQLLRLKKHQKVNHFPGSGYVTNKVNLATSGLPHVPVAFKIPDQKEDLIQYAQKNPDHLFVQKSNNHRGIKIQPVGDLDLDTPNTFVQQFIHRPLLIDGHKFDIGVYTIITSVQPLRVYIYDGDILFRFCPTPYHPFDAGDVDKYVVGDDYLPIWEVPSLRSYYKDMGFGMKESFNAYLRSLGRDPRMLWHQVDDAIRAMLLSRELALAAAIKKFGGPSSSHFFEMMRVDFVIDEDLNVYIMEANMSPNLSSQHFPPNRLLYEQVLFNLFKLVGLIPPRPNRQKITESQLLRQGEGAFKDLAVFPEQCGHCNPTNCSINGLCRLCRTCMDRELEDVLWEAFREHTDKHLCRRIVPPTLTVEEAVTGIDVDGLTDINQLMHHWFRGKCLLDPTWC